MMQSLAGWCLSYCRDKDSKDMALSSVITTAHTSTRLDLDAGPAKGIQHQVRRPSCHPRGVFLHRGLLDSRDLLDSSKLSPQRNPQPVRQCHVYTSGPNGPIKVATNSES